MVINTTGGSFSASTGSLDSNLGEIVGKTYQSNTITLTQGFLQPLSQITTGLEHFYKELGFSYYPNPATYAFTLESEGLNKINRVSFYDMAGRLVKSIDFGQGLLDVSSLQQGMYLVQALDSQGLPIHSFKLIKQ